MASASQAPARQRWQQAARPRTGAVRLLATRMTRDARTRNVAFAGLFAFYAYVQPVGYRSAYPSLPERLAFARSFAGNDALRLFYGYPFDASAVSGYTAWRVGGTLAIAAAVFGVLAAVRCLRAEEESGRAELVLAAPVTRGELQRSALVAIGAGAALLWCAQLAGYLAGGLPLGGSAYLALTVCTVAVVYGGIGALASQIASTRRLALELGVGAVAVGLLLRVVADTTGGAGWARWTTPLGWAEQARPFTGAQPLSLLPAAVLAALLFAVSHRIAARRDTGTGLLTERPVARPRTRLLRSAATQSVRLQLGSLLAWGLGVGLFALVLGVVSSSVGSAGISHAMRREIARLGSGSIATPSGYLAVVFLFFAVVMSLFLCAQVAAARREEAGGTLETLLAEPVSRRRWLAARMLLAVAYASALALLTGLLAWAGATAEGVHVSLARMLEAGANCLPAACLLGAVAALAWTLLPRAGVGLGYALVAVAFLWQLVGSLVSAPRWLLDATPFAHIGLVPTEAFRAGDAAAMAALALGAGLLAVACFARRDLTGE